MTKRWHWIGRLLIALVAIELPYLAGAFLWPGESAAEILVFGSGLTAVILVDTLFGVAGFGQVLSPFVDGVSLALIGAVTVAGVAALTRGESWRRCLAPSAAMIASAYAVVALWLISLM